MKVKPNEIANLCSIYLTLRVSRIRFNRLSKYLYDCMLLDSSATPSDIIKLAAELELIREESGYYTLSQKGRILGKYQERPDYKISDRAGEYLLKSFYLNPTSQCFCGRFLQQFHTDAVLETFVYYRTPKETEDILGLLMTLNQLGLLEVDHQKAIVKHDYIDIVSQGRSQTIGGTQEDCIEDPEFLLVGEIAEKCALEYEKERLRKCGRTDLSLLVQRISLVDKYAGYDILSYSGKGSRPETPIFIEVKGTRNNLVQFTWSKNERRVARAKRSSYWIYCYCKVDLDNAAAFGPTRINDPINNLKRLHYKIEPQDVFVYKR